MSEDKYLIIPGIRTFDLKKTVDIKYREGWIVSEQNYTGDDNWELVLVRNPHPTLDSA